MAKEVKIKISQKGAKVVGKALKGVTRGLSSMAKASAFAGVSAGALSVKLAGDFQKSLMEVSTLMDKVNSRTLPKMSRELRNVASTSGLALSSISKAKYDIVSAGFSNAADSAKVLEASSRLAVGGVTSAAAAADLLTTALNAYGKTAEDVNKVSDTLFTTVKLGKTTMNELAGSLGRVLPFSKAMGLSLNDVGASMAVLTASGINTAESTTALVSAITALNAPADSARDSMRNAGIEVKRFDDGTVDLAGTIKQFQGLDQATIKNFIPNIRAIAGIQTLANNFDKLQQNIKKFDESSMGATQEAFDRMLKAFNTQFAKFRNNLQNIMITVGDVIIKKIQPKIEEANNTMEKLGKIGWENVGKAIGNQVEAIGEAIVLTFKESFSVVARLADLSVSKIVDRMAKAVNPFYKDQTANIAYQAKEVAVTNEDSANRISKAWQKLYKNIESGAMLAKEEQDKANAELDRIEKEAEEASKAMNNGFTDVNGTLKNTLGDLLKIRQTLDTEGWQPEAVEPPELPEGWDRGINFFEGLQVAMANTSNQDQEFWTGLSEQMTVGLETTRQFADATNGIFQAQYKYRKQLLDNQKNSEIKELQDSFKREKEQIIADNTVQGQLTEAGHKKLQELEQAHNAKIQNTKEEFQQKDLELKRKMKPAKIAQAISSTALGVTNALGSVPPPFNLALAALVGATGAIEIATIQAQEFAKGGIVPGTGNKDTVPAMLTPGELILNKSQQENLVGGMGGITINISAPLVDETIVDTIIPAIEKAQKMNLA